MRSFKDLQTDPKRPASTDPRDYVFVGAVDKKRGWTEVRHDILARYGVQTGERNRHSLRGVPFYDTDEGRWLARCDHCGATREAGLRSNIYYFCLFLHKDSGIVITLGRECAAKQNFGTKDERDFETRRDEYLRGEERANWKSAHPDEVAFLESYIDHHIKGGKYIEFLDSLWADLERRDSLTDKQLEALRKWMARPQDWTRAQRIDADRHKGTVTRVSEEPTEAQLAYIKKLCDDIDQDFIDPEDLETRQSASDLINRLKAAKMMAEGSQKPPPVVEEDATERQVSFINKLMDERRMAPDARREARARLDNGITKRVASQWIEKLLSLDRIDDDGSQHSDGTRTAA